MSSSPYWILRTDSSENLVPKKSECAMSCLTCRGGRVQWDPDCEVWNSTTTKGQKSEDKKAVACSSAHLFIRSDRDGVDILIFIMPIISLLSLTHILSSTIADAVSSRSSESKRNLTVSSASVWSSSRWGLVTPSGLIKGRNKKFQWRAEAERDISKTQ